MTCFTGGHVPLALLAITLLLISVAVIPMVIIIALRKLPRVSVTGSIFYLYNSVWFGNLVCYSLITYIMA